MYRKEERAKWGKRDYSGLTNEDFDRLLVAEIRKDPLEYILHNIPGVCEAVSEYYNNAVRDAWELQQDNNAREAKDD